ncbi:MAG: hypothetical protein S4CHLAM2_06930 [Chlamydiales bacterium]|nr:hypothetical protein [Chlamydiales bacterium]
MRLLSSFILISLSFALGATNLEITAPKGWECINDPDQLPQKVCRLYVGTGKSQFSPSINIACEETTMLSDEYLALAKSYHEGEGDTRCRPLGKVKTQAGQADLLQIDRSTQWGNVRFLQAVVVRDHTAYVITATCLQQEFASLSPQLLKSIQSFELH